MLALPGLDQRIAPFKAPAQALHEFVGDWLQHLNIVFALYWLALVTNIESPILRNRRVRVRWVIRRNSNRPQHQWPGEELPPISNHGPLRHLTHSIEGPFQL
jgi:hypothetical protein